MIKGDRGFYRGLSKWVTSTLSSGKVSSPPLWKIDYKSQYTKLSPTLYTHKPSLIKMSTDHCIKSKAYKTLERKMKRYTSN